MKWWMKVWLLYVCIDCIPDTYEIVQNWKCSMCNDIKPNQNHPNWAWKTVFSFQSEKFQFWMSIFVWDNWLWFKCLNLHLIGWGGGSKGPIFSKESTVIFYPFFWPGCMRMKMQLSTMSSILKMVTLLLQFYSKPIQLVKS